MLPTLVSLARAAILFGIALIFAGFIGLYITPAYRRWRAYRNLISSTRKS